MRRSPILLLVLAALVAGCSSTGTEGASPISSTIDAQGGVPVGSATFTHRVDATFAPATPENEPAAAIFPGDPVSLIGG
ncbi:MAG: hypothetical protein WBV89_17700, partial [Ilumatobacter sp.]